MRGESACVDAERPWSRTFQTKSTAESGKHSWRPNSNATGGPLNIDHSHAWSLRRYLDVTTNQVLLASASSPVNTILLMAPNAASGIGKRVGRRHPAIMSTSASPARFTDGRRHSRLPAKRAGKGCAQSTDSFGLRSAEHPLNWCNSQLLGRDRGDNKPLSPLGTGRTQTDEKLRYREGSAAAVSVREHHHLGTSDRRGGRWTNRRMAATQLSAPA